MSIVTLDRKSGTLQMRASVMKRSRKVHITHTITHTKVSIKCVTFLFQYNIPHKYDFYISDNEKNSIRLANNLMEQYKEHLNSLGTDGSKSLIIDIETEISKEKREPCNGFSRYEKSCENCFLFKIVFYKKFLSNILFLLCKCVS